MPAKKKLRSPKSFPKSSQWKVQDDYRHKLSDADREWLDKFNESEFGGNPSAMFKRPGKRRRQRANRERYVSRHDVLNVSVPLNSRDIVANPEDALIDLIDLNSGVCPKCEGRLSACRCIRND